jgi:DNA repair exonuclease SbcCD nuclease subunit
MNRRSVWALAAALVISVAAGCRREFPADVVRRTTISITEMRPAAGQLALPKKAGSVRFAVIGDSGRGDDAQYQTAAQLIAWREQFPFDFVLMLGDNVYDHHTPADYQRRFEQPYRPLLDAGVTFHAAIGNHDDPAQMFYEKFNMGGVRYYSFRRAEMSLRGGLTGAGVRFFVLDSRSLDSGQLAWLHQQLRDSGSRWKIVYFHHPLYTSGRYRTAARLLRDELEPVLVAGDVDVVLAGHEHFYERLTPQRGIAYFVAGASGALRKGDIRPSDLTARGFDDDNSFLLMEVAGNELYFQAVSRTGKTVDAGVIRKD